MYAKIQFVQLLLVKWVEGGRSDYNCAGPDTRVAGFFATPSKTLGIEISIIISASGQPTDQYYLYFSRTADDYWDLMGSGTFKSTY
ncbi:hypothetical protein [Cytobacillus kochii]|uniref:hypothetical protein n=1 Tax=Cytobacillus kochii TaxID=859143 RepID=UPI00402AAC14